MASWLAFSVVSPAQSNTHANWTGRPRVGKMRGSHRFRPNSRMVSLGAGMARRFINRSAGRPPVEWPNSRTNSATRWVRRASRAAIAGSCSTKVCRPHRRLRQRQRPGGLTRSTFCYHRRRPVAPARCSRRSVSRCRRWSSRSRPARRRPMRDQPHCPAAADARGVVSCRPEFSGFAFYIKKFVKVTVQLE